MKKEIPTHGYQRYHIEIKHAANIIPHPHRFSVHVNKIKLAQLLIKELFHYKGNLKVVKSRPCVYGVFSGPAGGFLPRDRLCVGCLRCTTEYPKMVTISPNKKREKLGDSYLTAHLIDTLNYEAETGRVPIRGAGFRGTFGGEGFDGMWTDMSEIVRPTRDGIHGREFISTEVDVGGKLSKVDFSNLDNYPQTYSLPIPLLFDIREEKILSKKLCEILSQAADQLKTFVFLPFDILKKFHVKHRSIIPILKPYQYEAFLQFEFTPRMLALEGWDEGIYFDISSKFSHTEIILRTSFDNTKLIEYFKKGVRIFHLIANYQGKCEETFLIDLIRKANELFVKEKVRDEVTLLGGGGIVAAEHLAKSILCGLDAVSIDTALLIALQAKMSNEWKEEGQIVLKLPSFLKEEWGIQRLKNLSAAWRDQLIEIMGAMGIREVRRLRGEMGRAMFQKDLEKEAFKDILKV